MYFLLFLIMIFLVKNVNPSQNDLGDELVPELSTDEQSIDPLGMEASLASPVVFENLAADEGDIREQINPEISLADLRVDTAYSSSMANSLREPDYLDSDVSNVLDQGYAVVAHDDCFSGDNPRKLEKTKEPVEEKPVEEKPVDEKPGEGREGQFRFCPRNPMFMNSRKERRNCATSKDTFCAWGPVDLPFVDNCIGCME